MIRNHNSLLNDLPVVVINGDDVDVYGAVTIVDLQKLDPLSRDETLQELLGPRPVVTVVIEFGHGAVPELLDVEISNALGDRGYQVRSIATYPGNLIQEPDDDDTQ